MSYSTEDIRNLALVGQAGAGKTLLIEAMLSHSGAVTSKGEIGRGTTVSDSDVLEKKHLRSLNSTIMHTDFAGKHINLIDTPGYSDFMGPALAALEAVEVAAVVINAQAGVETMTRRFMEWAKERKLCRLIIVNRIDGENVDLEAVYSTIQEEFGSECLALNLPANGGAEVAACYPETSGTADFSSTEDARLEVIEQVVEMDDDIMEEYLEEGEISTDRLGGVFYEALRDGHLVPVCFTSAESQAGIPELLDIITELLPDPTAGNMPVFLTAEGERSEWLNFVADADKVLVAHVFKNVYDPFVGKLGIFRIFQGRIDRDASINIADHRKAFRVANLYELQGRKLIDQPSGIAGDIRGIAKIEELNTGVIIHTDKSGMTVQLKQHDIPSPMVGLAVSPASRGDEQKVSESLQRIAAEDPCITVERNADANETILRGMGDLHLRIALERLSEVYNVQVDTSVPTVPYRETVTRIAEGHCRHKKQTGGAGQFGEVFLRVEPRPRGEGFEFVDNIVGGVIPSQFIPAVEKGIRQVLDTGAFAGFPVQDVRVVVHDGKFHSVDSKEIAFVTAGRKAFVDAFEKAGPIVLEPIVDVIIDAPSANMGDIAGELSARRGRISDTDSGAANTVRISGLSPLAEMADFQARLNAITGGEGSFFMKFSSYEPAPMDVQKKLSASFQKVDED